MNCSAFLVRMGSMQGAPWMQIKFLPKYSGVLFSSVISHEETFVAGYASPVSICAFIVSQHGSQASIQLQD